MCGTVYGEMHLKDLLGSFVRVGYRIPVPDFYLVLHGLRCRKSTIMDSTKKLIEKIHMKLTELDTNALFARSKIIWIAIWIAIQKMYPFTRDIHCSNQCIKAHHIIGHCSVIVSSQSNNWIENTQITIQIVCLHMTKFLDPDQDPDHVCCA